MFKKTDLAGWKSDIDELDIGKLENTPFKGVKQCSRKWCFLKNCILRIGLKCECYSGYWY